METPDQGGVTLLDRAAVLATVDLQIEPVDVPEWGGRLFVRVMSARERDRYELTLARQRDAGAWNIRALMVACGACDQHGRALFAVSDVEALGDKSVDAMERVAAAVDRLNGLSPQTREAIGKKSQSPASASGSASPGTSASLSAH